MKKVVLLLLSILICLTAKSQSRPEIVGLPYNSSDAGWYASARYSNNISKNWKYAVGLTFHYNQILLPDRNFDLFLHKRFYASTGIQRIGFLGSIARQVNMFANKNISTSFYYEMTFRGMDALSYRYVPSYTYYNADSSFQYLVSNKVETRIKNLKSFENIVGISMRAKVWKSVAFISELGAGSNLIFNVPSFISKDGFVAEYSVKYSLGLAVGL